AILFLLLENDRSINELAEAINQPATVISNHLLKLRSEGIVDYTRYHRVLEYRLVSKDAIAILQTLKNLQAYPQQVA
ncbi:MAG: ArsR/SmtB family transcription factor, partial [Shewanella sp.]